VVLVWRRPGGGFEPPETIVNQPPYGRTQFGGAAALADASREVLVIHMPGGPFGKEEHLFLRGAAGARGWSDHILGPGTFGGWVLGFENDTAWAVGPCSGGACALFEER
jgi:hypothetical protein